MSIFSYDKAQKALQLCFENSDEDLEIEEVLDAAKKTYDFLMGESHHFKETEETEEKIFPFYGSLQEFLDDRISKMKESMKEKEKPVSTEEELVKKRLKVLIPLPYPGRSRELGLLRAYEDVYGKFNRHFDHLLNPKINVFG